LFERAGADVIRDPFTGIRYVNGYRIDCVHVLTRAYYDSPRATCFTKSGRRRRRRSRLKRIGAATCTRTSYAHHTRVQTGTRPELINRSVYANARCTNLVKKSRARARVTGEEKKENYTRVRDTRTHKNRPPLNFTTVSVQIVTHISGVRFFGTYDPRPPVPKQYHLLNCLSEAHHGDPSENLHTRARRAHVTRTYTHTHVYPTPLF